MRFGSRFIIRNFTLPFPILLPTTYPSYPSLTPYISRLFKSIIGLPLSVYLFFLLSRSLSNSLSPLILSSSLFSFSILSSLFSNLYLLFSILFSLFSILILYSLFSTNSIKPSGRCANTKTSFATTVRSLHLGLGQLVRAAS